MAVAVTDGEPALDAPTGDVAAEADRPVGFAVHLDVFSGPFDVLLALIARHELDITEIALSRVTDEFIDHISQRAGDWDLDQASYFLLVAATLLDLKSVRLLPSGDVEDEEDLALLEERDLLFARLLQYRAYKKVATVLARRLAEASRRFPRRVALEPAFAALRPDVRLGVDPAGFAELAARVLAPRRPPSVATDHLHPPPGSVQDRANLLAATLRRLRRASFRRLTRSCSATEEVVTCFLALLELFRDNRVALEQVAPFDDLYAVWAGDGDAVAASPGGGPATGTVGAGRSVDAR